MSSITTVIGLCTGVCALCFYVLFKMFILLHAPRTLIVVDVILLFACLVTIGICLSANTVGITVSSLFR